MSNTFNKIIPTSTVGRGKSFKSLQDSNAIDLWQDNNVTLQLGDSFNYYQSWEKPTVIISDGGYGILGFEGDTSDHMGLPKWYEDHIKAWSEFATAQTTLWFWNSEIGWAVIHPILEKYGWRYINCNIWNKGKGHIAGNVNTEKIRRFPVVTEVCAQYIFEGKIDGLSLRDWLRKEWKRTKLPLRKANEACGVKNAASRKYLDPGHLWYFPPPAMFEKMADYANKFGNEEGKPYFSRNGKYPLTAEEWNQMRAKFNCPHGFTNVWERNPLRDRERVKAPKKSSKSAHLNQKPLDLMKLIIQASSDKQDVIWEPFGGLFSASLAARIVGRKAFSCEIDPDYFKLGVDRFQNKILFNT
jgi:DNA modification methylase